MATKTYTVGTDTAADVDKLRDELEQLWQVRPTYSQVLKHAVYVARLKLKQKEEGRDD